MITYSIVDVDYPGDPWVDFGEMVARGEDLISCQAFGLFAIVDLDFGAAGRCRWVGALVGLAWALAKWRVTRPPHMRFYPLDQGDVLDVDLRDGLVHVRTAVCQVAVADAEWEAAVADFLTEFRADICAHGVGPKLAWDWTMLT